MSHEFSHKHIHSVVWLITIILALVIVAGVVIVLLNNNEPLAPELPAISVEQALSSKPSVNQPPANNNQAQEPNQPQPASGVKVSLETTSPVSLGSEVEVKVLLDTGGHNINVAKIGLVYDPANLRYLGFDKSNSVLPMDFRNEATAGEVVMSRGAAGDANPNDNDDGYTGSNGLFGIFRFTALNQGRTSLSLDTANTLFYLDDGQGSQLQPALEKLDLTIN